MTTPKQKSIRRGTRAVKNPRRRRRNRSSFAFRSKAPSWALPVKQRRRLSRRRARARVIMGAAAPRKRVMKLRVRKNPVGKFFIRAATSGKDYFYRQSTQSFIDRKADATAYKSKLIATRLARSLLEKLPGSIQSLTVVT